MMQIGLFFGSFNPIHIGHLALANHMLITENLAQIWFVVSPQNPFKKNNDLADAYHRLKMVEVALENHNQYKVSDIELSLPSPSYTINTLNALQERFPTYQFTIIMGADNLLMLNRWKNADQIIANHKILVYPRPNVAINNTLGDNVIITDAPQLNISSTHIRNFLHQGLDVRFMLPAGVYDYINQHNLYR